MHILDIYQKIIFVICFDEDALLSLRGQNVLENILTETFSQNTLVDNKIINVNTC